MRPVQLLPRVAEVAPGVFEKRLTSRELDDAHAVMHLRAEAKLLKALGGIVTPAFVDAGDDARGPWLRMARVPFPTLAERLENVGGPLAPAWIERCARAAFHALAVVHEARDDSGPLHIVHADISPANLAADSDARHVVLLDFGLSCFRGFPQRDGAFRGTIAFAAPEVARSEVPTPKSDLFSLAAALVAAAMGKSPRPPLPLPALIAMAADVPIVTSEILVLADRGPAHAALVRCLAHDPALRPDSAREIATMLG